MNKLLAGLAVGFAVVGAGCGEQGWGDPRVTSCCTSTMLVFERTGGPDFDLASWRLDLGPIGSATTCLFGTGGWQCNNPDFIGVPPPPGTRGMPRVTELRLRMSVPQLGERTGIPIRGYRAVRPLSEPIPTTSVPACSSDDDAPRIQVMLPMPVGGDAT